MDETAVKRRYLGDGVYAFLQHGGIELRANDAHAPTDRVYLEPDVLRALVGFAAENEVAL